MAPGKTTRDTPACHARDIIRTPVDKGGRQRILAVCAACGAFRDVTGIPRPEVFELLHEDWELDGHTLTPPEDSD
ncbi:MAG: hypothetical protein ACE5R4_14895 [Armatimonadota bacterium]